MQASSVGADPEVAFVVFHDRADLRVIKSGTLGGKIADAGTVHARDAGAKRADPERARTVLEKRRDTGAEPFTSAVLRGDAVALHADDFSIEGAPPAGGWRGGDHGSAIWEHFSAGTQRGKGVAIAREHSFIGPQEN